MTVTALLVSHDGARWLPAVLAGLRDQQRRPDRILAVDTGSNDGTLDLLRAALGADSVLQTRGSYPEAVAHGLAHIDSEWVWLLHDDCRPEPDVLAVLLETATDRGADAVGPKLREWPSLRRLLEVGVTISATGRRETGLERGEYDQGQHDDVRRVLAVNTAGMLVRREVLTALDGFDDALPFFGNDIDFGWRAARAGYTTLVVPEAVVFHAEAAHRGVRRTTSTGRRTRTHRAEREAALFTLLANCEPRTLPVQALRLFLGTWLRIVGFLLARSPGLAGDEFAALLEVFGRPGRIRVARRARSTLRGGDLEEVRQLLAPWWLPYRHGLDNISDLVTAATNQGRDAAERRRMARTGAPVDDEDDALAEDSGLVARLLTSPVALAAVVLSALWLWGARDVLHPIAGGALSPAPAEAADWWRLLIEGWHQLGQGTDAPAPGYLLPLALAASLLPGSPAAMVSLLFLASVPVSAWGAWRFLRVVAGRGDAPLVGRHLALVAGGALAYAAVPLASGAWGQGRFGVLASAALLPWFAHAALGLAEPLADRRWRAGWRCGLLLAVITAFTPSAWLLAAIVVAVAATAGFLAAPDWIRDRATWGPLAAIVLAPLVLSLPGTLGLLGHDVTAVFLEAGRLMPTPGGLELLAGRFGAPAAPAWLGVLLLVPALAALVPERTRVPVLAAWLLVAVAAVLAAVLSHVDITLPAGEAHAGVGFLLVLIQAALVTAVVAAGSGVLSGVEGSSFGWRQPVVAILAAGAALVPVGGLGWWLLAGTDQLGPPPQADVPVYMAQAAEEGAGHGVLVLRGSVADGITWSVHRGDGITLGEDEVLLLTSPDPAVTRDVRALLSRPTPEAVARLPRHGLDYIVQPTPADPQVAATLDAAAGLAQASSPDRSTRAWQFDQAAPADAVAGDRSWLHTLMLFVQLVALLVVAVLCGPTRRTEP